VDLADEAQVKALVHEVVRRRGRIDILINSAGVMADALPITELAADIRVSCVCPGSIDTPMLRRQENADIETALIERASAAGRVGLPEEVAALIHFLTAGDCRYINGQVIVIDGGLVGLHSNALIETIVGARSRL
jgi:NAD(P)-dependent dehydrogenase (short-subunit alcohol dehydrogenase family)